MGSGGRSVAVGRATLLHLALAGAVLLAPARPTPASVSLYMPPESLAERAPLVLEAEVGSSRAGLDPASGRLATYVTLEVLHVHRGPPGLEQVVIREAGGSFGGLRLELDAVPVYREGERVLVFLEPASDGALRTAGLFFGKFLLRPAARAGWEAARELSGRGTIIARPTPERWETFSLGDLAAVAAAIPPRRPEAAGPGRRETLGPGHRATTSARPPVRRWLARPPELGRVLWEPGEGAGGDRADVALSGETGGISVSSFDPRGTASLHFTPLDPGTPARWHEADSDTALVVDVERARNPLGDGAAALAEMQRALAAWSEVPESRISLVVGDGDADFTGAPSSASPAVSYPPGNIILFGDPYDDMGDPDPVLCRGVLAIGGHWSGGTPVKTVNNVSFVPALRLFVIFNRDFECFLGHGDNLAEVAAHELGHGLGFGHSADEIDALMRPWAYGWRGPRLGDDDRDAAHCHYPHTLALLEPLGGEDWPAGSAQTIRWSSSVETGPDPGTVDLELSSDGGQSWSPLAAAESNDGLYSWTVPDTPGTSFRVRVLRPNRFTPTPAPYPSACSGDASPASFTISSPPVVAGSVPDGSTGPPLQVSPGGGQTLLLEWGASCSTGAEDYAVYEGSLEALAAGGWDHLPATCSAGTDLAETLTPEAGNRYFLVAPLAGGSEGESGSGSSGIPRPASLSACAPREPAGCP
jgi:hypothetical protein